MGDGCLSCRRSNARARQRSCNSPTEQLPPPCSTLLFLRVQSNWPGNTQRPAVFSVFLWSSHKDLRGFTKTKFQFWVVHKPLRVFYCASFLPKPQRRKENASFREGCDLPIRSFIRHLASRPYCQVLQHGLFGAFSMAGGLRCCLNQRNEIIWNPCSILIHLRFSLHRFNWDFSNTCGKIKIQRGTASDTSSREFTQKCPELILRVHTICFMTFCELAVLSTIYIFLISLPNES